ncbi:ABC transporter ATP-binding protein [Candidatus Daviesbacteria bacterium]|nr:ABC transporter ATP-binding protein [Candidatus Daviesbacteria bacterium]
MAKNIVLEVSNLQKKFGDYFAVDNISFKASEGEIVGLLGPNGAGKTTTINMLLGILTPTAGEIMFFGKNFFAQREDVLKDINFCSSYIKLPWRLTVYENLEVMAMLYGVKNIKPRIMKFLEVFEMAEYIKSPISALSAGQIMRVMLAKAFLNHPKLILLDEPTASLDPDVAKKVRDFLLKQQREYGTTMLLTSHNMAEVEQLCDRVIFLHKGKILAEDSPDGLSRRIKTATIELLIPKNKLKKAIEKCQNLGWKAQAEGRYLKVDLEESEIVKLLLVLNGADIEFTEINIEKPDLEDFFIKVAQEGIS